MINKNNIISIIVPIYNIENHLRKCVDSLLEQSYKNIEIVLVDDGSTDLSSEICDIYSKKDKRVKVIHKKNGGLSSARNVGLDNCNGNYVMFVDGDDWIDRECCQIINRILDGYNYDVILFPYIREYKNKSIERKLFTTSIEFFGVDFTKLYSRIIGLINDDMKNPEMLDSLSTAWGKVFKKKCISKPFVDTKIIGTEDLLFNVSNLKNMSSAYYTDGTYYHYNKLNDISLTKGFSLEKYKKNKVLLGYIYNEIKYNDNFEDRLNRLNTRRVMSIFNFIYTICSSNLNVLKKYFYIKIIIKDDYNTKYYNHFKSQLKYMPVKWKGLYFLVLNKQSLLLCVCMSFLCYLWRKKNG